MDTGSPWSTPSGGAWSYEYFGEMTAAPAMLDDGRIVFSLSTLWMLTNMDVGIVGLVCLDPPSQYLLSWAYYGAPGNAPYTTAACVTSDLLYIGGADGRIDAISPAGGALMWSFAAGSPIRTELTAAGGLILFGTGDGRIQALDIATRALRWSVPAQPVAPSPYFLTRVAVRGGQALWGVTATKGAKGSIHCYDLATGRKNWVIPAAGAAVTSDPITGGGLVFFGTANGLLSGYDEQDNTKLQIQTGGAIVGAAACDEKYVYVGSTNGTFYAKALRADVEPREWQVPVTGSIGTRILLSGPDACFGGNNAAGLPAFYTLDLASAASQSARVLVEALESRIQLAPEARRGRIAFSDGGKEGGRLYAIEMSEKGMLERVVFASSLVVDDYDVSGSEAVPLKPAFQMSATILDEQLAPMPNANVALWAATPISLVCNGQEIHLGATSGEAVSVQADAGGLLAMTAPADVGMPSLFLRPDSFLPSYSLEVYPDLQNLNGLAQLTGDQLKDARSYDGQGVVQAAYVASTEAIASSVRNTIGFRQNTGAPGLTKATTGASAAKQGTNPGAVPSWTTEIHADRVTFKPLEASEIELWFGATRQVAAASGGFASFVNNVVHGTESASKVMWHYANDAASVFVQTAVAEYRFIAQTVEQAVQVMKAVIETVVTSIEKFIEWLSFLFNWDDIVATHRAILSQVDTTFNALTSWIDGQLATGAADFKALIAGWKSTAAAAFGTVPPQLAGSTTGSTQQSAGPMSAFFRPGGVDITVPSQWLTKKVHANMTVLPQLTGGDELVALFDAYVAKVQNAVATDPALQQLPEDLAAVITSFVKLNTDPGGFLAQAMDAVVQVFADLVDIGLELLETMVLALLEFVRDAIRLLRKMLTAKIDIPFVSDFYRLVAGSDLSLLSLVSLGLAVPTTIIYKIEHKRAPFPSGQADVDSALTGLEITSAAAYFSMMWLWTAVVLPDDKTFLKLSCGLVAADAVILMGLWAGSLGITGATGADWAYWTVQVVQPIMYSYSFAVIGTPAQKHWDEASPGGFAGVGALGAAWAAMYAGLFPETYWNDGKNFTINFTPNLALLSPQVYKSLGKKNQAAVAALILLNFFSYGTAMALTVVEEFT